MKQAMQTIEFEGVKYKAKEITFEGVLYTIAETKLNDAIMNDGVYKNQEARFIDEGIVYFCSRSEMRLSNNKLCAIIF